MAKKKKKRVKERLARKRGMRAAQSRQRRKKPPKISKKTANLSDEERRAAEIGLARSPLLLSALEFTDFHFDSERLASYLEDVKSSELKDSEEFLSRGLAELVDEEFVAEVRLRLSHHMQTQRDEDPQSAFSASLVFSLMDKVKELYTIPFFAAFFVRDVKEHPLADDPLIWELLSPYLPSRIVKPEDEKKKEEEVAQEEEPQKSKEYPHLILPKGYEEAGK